MNFFVKMVIATFGAFTFVIMGLIMIIWMPIAWVLAKLMGIDTK